MTPSRHPERYHADREAAYRLLDEALHCHLGFVVDGAPVVLPTLHVRVADRLFLHGSTGSGWMLSAARGHGLPVAVAVTRVEAAVMARAAFNHSVNYRSVVVHGVAEPVTRAEAKRAALDALVEHLCRGRAADARPPTDKELAATSVLGLALDTLTYKQRSGPPGDEPEDLDLPVWAGLVPFTVAPGFPEADAGTSVAAPDYLRDVTLP